MWERTEWSGCLEGAQREGGPRRCKDPGRVSRKDADLGVGREAPAARTVPWAVRGTRRLGDLSWVMPPSSLRCTATPSAWSLVSLSLIETFVLSLGMRRFFPSFIGTSEHPKFFIKSICYF